MVPSIPPEWHELLTELLTELLKYLFGAAVLVGRKVCRDVNKAFAKLRSLERRVEALEKAGKIEAQDPQHEGERKHAC